MLINVSTFFRIRHSAVERTGSALHDAPKAYRLEVKGRGDKDRKDFKDRKVIKVFKDSVEQLTYVRYPFGIASAESIFRKDNVDNRGHKTALWYAVFAIHF